MSMPEIKASGKRPIQLRWDGGTVVITPEDQNRFVKESQWAVTALQSAMAAERFIEQFKSEFLARIRLWCEEHKHLVRACFVPFPADPLAVFVISQKARYDFDLADPVADLEMELFQRNWPVEVLQLPVGSPESLLSFFNPVDCIQVYGDAI